VYTGCPMSLCCFAFLLVLTIAALHAQAPSLSPEGSQADRSSLLATEMENNAPHTAAEHSEILKRNMWNGILTTVSPTGVHHTPSSRIIDGAASRAPDASGVKRENKLTNYVVDVYNGTTGLIGYDKEVIETAHAYPRRISRHSPTAWMYL
jgi:hypothetical protein